MAALEATPFANAVAVVSLEDASKSDGQVSLPEGTIRLAVSIKVSFGVADLVWLALRVLFFPDVDQGLGCALVMTFRSSRNENLRILVSCVLCRRSAASLR